MSKSAALIEISHLRVHNANAVSGPLSWGFPAPGSFMGFVHALERKLNNTEFGGVGIICHKFEPQALRPRGGYNYTFQLMRHPYIAGGRPFRNKAGALVEEGRAHLEVTLLIELLGDEPLTDDEYKCMTMEIQVLVSGMRIAGGAVHQAVPKVCIHEWPETEDEAREEFFHKRYRWLPGFALVERRDLLGEHLANLRRQLSETDALEAMLDLLALHTEPKPPEETEDKTNLSTEKAGRKSDLTEWISRKRRPGWLVPLPVGFGALSELQEPGSVRNARDMTVPFRFVESVYSVGQWLSPHRLTSLEHLLWRMESDAEHGLYLCRNNYSTKE